MRENNISELTLASKMAAAAASTLDGIDIERYRAELAEFQLTPEQETELLETLRSIMEAMVRMSIEIDVCGLIFDEFNQASGQPDGDAMLGASPNSEKPSTGKDGTS
jgi:hypothetical protein